MPAKSEAQRKLFTTALSVKKGDTPRKDVGKAVLKLVDSMSEKELEKYSYSVKEGDVNEATTSASSGAYETSFGVSSKSEMKMLDNLKENKGFNITLEQLESIVKRCVIKEEVYSEKPSTSGKKAYNQTGEEKGKTTSTKNAKKQKVYSSLAGKATNANTKKSGEESSKANRESVAKVNKNQEGNLKDKSVVDVNKNKVQNEDQRIEAGQNGMEDLTYDNISNEKQKKNKEIYLNQSAMEDPNAQDTGIHQQNLDDAKKRKDSKESSKFRTAKMYGSDVEYIDGAESAHSKELAFENTIKKYTFKNSFKDTKTMLKKIPEMAKNNDTIFEMFDGESKYKVRWEGNKKSGVGVILEHRNDKKEKAEYERLMFLSEYDSSNTETSKLNEHDIFKNMINDARNLINEEENVEVVEKKYINEEAAFVADKRDNKYAINNRNTVKLAQQLLSLYTGRNLAIDGIAGKQTANAIQKFHEISGGDAAKRELSKSDLIKLFNEVTGNLVGVTKGFDFKVGERGDDVKVLQLLLNISIGTNLKVDGIYGRNTAMAVQKFNKWASIDNKNASRKTFLTAYNIASGKIASQLGESVKKKNTLTEAWKAQKGGVGKGQKNYYNDVRAVQIALNDVVNTNLRVDGKYGKNTQTAIAKFLKSIKYQNYQSKPFLDKATFHTLMLKYLKGKRFKTPVGYKQKHSREDVYKLQTLLNGAGANLVIDGAFGKKTLAAIVAFNKKYFPKAKNKYVITPQQYDKLFQLAM